MIRFLAGAAVGICSGATAVILWALCAVKKKSGKRMTRADRIRSMTNEELADFAMDTEIDDYFHFCKNNEECDNLEIADRKTRCRKCLTEYLEGDYEES